MLLQSNTVKLLIILLTCIHGLKCASEFPFLSFWKISAHHVVTHPFTHPISISLHFLCTHLSLSLSLHVSSAPCCCYASMCSLFNSQLELFTFNFLLSIFTAFKLGVEYTIMHPSFSLYLSATVFSSIYLYFSFFCSSNFNYATYTVRIYNYRKVAIVRTHNLFLYYFCA